MRVRLGASGIDVRGAASIFQQQAAFGDDTFKRIGGTTQ